MASDPAHRQEEDQLLSQLKTETIARNKSWREDVGEDAPRNSPPSLVAGAFGKVASAMATERHEDIRHVMKEAKPAEAVPDEQVLQQHIHKLAEEAKAREMQEHEGIIPRHSVASKLQSADAKIERCAQVEALFPDQPAAVPRPHEAKK